MADEPLLPEDGAPISLDTPLFSVSEKDEPRIRKVVAQRSHCAPPGRLPSPDDYGLFVSSAWRLCQSNPREWLRREQHYQSLYRSAGVHKSTAPKPIAAGSASKRSSMGTSSRPRVSASGSASGTLGRQMQRPARAPRATPKLVPVDVFERITPPRSSVDSTTATPDSSDGNTLAAAPPPTTITSSSGTPAPRQRLAAPTREDSNFEALPDLTPPLSSLPPHNNRALMIDWRGNPLAIEAEPHFEKLHPAEAKLASTLRLTPAIYLSSKRRIFIEKVRRTRLGKEFRKTDSQKACKIDVNKASKLWTVFDRVGWFEPRYIEPHLDRDIHMEL